MAEHITLQFFDKFLEEFRLFRADVSKIRIALEALAARGMPVSLQVAETSLNPKENTMAKVKSAGVDFVIQQNGSVKFTATPTDAAGIAVALPAGTPPLVWVSDQPALVLSADPGDTSGFNLSQIGTPNALATGINVTGSTTLAGATAPITGAATPVDIVAAPDLPTGFTVAEQ